ncbi:Ig-like domain-containing protein [Halogeometricum borinquense]|uniref:Ig-like domain-containing protein n=1 Tax=Halogeometricum borinquense TaxID=60847 RepID=UPI00343AA4B4
MIRDRLEDARRPTIVAFALVATYLVASGAPVVVAESSGIVVGSQNTTDTDFRSATILSGVTVSGSGSDASVVLNSGVIDDGFEDGNINGWEGDTGNFSATTTQPHSGSYAMEFDGSGDNLEVHRNFTQDTHTRASWWLYDSDVSASNFRPRMVLGPQSFESVGPVLGIDDGSRTGGPGSIQYFDGAFWDTGIDISNDTYYKFVVHNISYSNDDFDLAVYYANGTLKDEATNLGFQDDISQIGRVQFKGSETKFNVDDVKVGSGSTGQYVSANHSVSDPEKLAVDLSLTNTNATVEAQFWDGSEWQVDNRSKVSTSANHTLTLASSSDTWRVNVTFTQTTDDATAELHDESFLFTDHSAEVSNPDPVNGSEMNAENVTLSVDISDPEFSTAQRDSVTVDLILDESVAGTETVTSNGSVAFDVGPLSDGNHTWHVETTDEYGPTSESDSFTWEIDHYEPTVNSSSMDPEDGAKLTSKDVTLSINASDRDFQLDGDTVTTEFVVDGEVVGTKNITSNGTVSTTISDVGGGNHSWYVRVYDEYGSGNSSNPDATSANKTYLVPSTLYIRPVNQPNELINGTNVTVTGRFFSGELVFERSTENGKLNLTDLPVDRTYVLVLEADGHNRRTVIITSLYEQDSVYLLNDSKTAYYTEFVLNDLTGEFSGSNERTKLYIERAVNTSSGLEWVTVSGDFFGAEGRFEATLEKDHRYRIRIVGEHNSSRVLGAYTATRKGTVTLNVGQVSWNVEDNTQAIRHSAAYIDLTDGNEEPNGVVHFQYHDPTQNTSKLRVIIHAANNSSNEIMNSTYTEGYGTFSLNKTVSGNLTETDWEVTWYAYNSSNAVIESSNDLADGKRYVIENPIGPKWTPVIVTCLFLFVGMLFGGRLSSIGSLAVTGVAAVMWWLGWYTASGGVVVFAGLVAVAMAVGGGGRR